MAARIRSASLGRSKRPLEPARRRCMGRSKSRSSPLGPAGALEMDARARSEPQGRSKLLEPARSRSGARNRCSSPPRCRRGARNGCSSLPRSRSGVRNGCSSPPRSHKGARNGWSSPPRSCKGAPTGCSSQPRSRSGVHKLRSKLLFGKAASVRLFSESLCSAQLCFVHGYARVRASIYL